MGRRKRIQEEKPQGKFVFKNKLSLNDVNETTVIPESDLCFQDQQYIYQFSYKKPQEQPILQIPPGIFTLVETATGNISVEEAQLRERQLLTSVVNSQKIIDEANAFFNNLHIYEELGESKARKILLHSNPGFGKSSLLTHYCQQAIKEDAGTVVIIWPTNEISSDQVLHFLSEDSEYTKECTRVILIIEDIGGGEREGSGNARAVDSGLLDLLDGLRVVFYLPTLIVATTNYPQNLLSALADRPGRFDLIMALKNTSYQEKISLLEFIGKRPLTDEEKKAFKTKDTEDFSVAHLKEVIVRSRLHNKTLNEVVKELINHKKNFKKSFEENNEVGFNRDEN